MLFALTIPHSRSSEAPEGAKVVAWTSTASHGQGGKILNRFILERAIIFLRQTMVSGGIFQRMKSPMQIERSLHACSSFLREYVLHPASFWKHRKSQGQI